MVPRAPHPARLAIKCNKILTDLRRRITANLWPPGGQLPTREELEKKYKASSRTVQRALTQLINDGFVRADGRRGTFVVDHPPHLSNYGLVFPFCPSQSDWSGHWEALTTAARTIMGGKPGTITQYYGMESPSNTAAYETLLADVCSHRLAGLVFSSPPYLLAKTPVLLEKGIPRVAVMAPGMFPNVGAVVYDADSYVRKALDYLAGHGCRRIGIIQHSSQRSEDTEAHRKLLQQIAARGLGLQPHWVQGVTPHTPGLTRNLVELLMRRPKADRPDGLLVTDDNIVTDVAAGLLAAGVNVPDQLRVVAHANFPCPPPAAVPVWYLGYDMAEVLHLAMAYIDCARRGDTPAEPMVVPARCKDDLIERADVDAKLQRIGGNDRCQLAALEPLLHHDARFARKRAVVRVSQRLRLPFVEQQCDPLAEAAVVGEQQRGAVAGDDALQLAH